MNEQNIIDSPNDLESNTYVIIQVRLTHELLSVYQLVVAITGQLDCDLLCLFAVQGPDLSAVVSNPSLSYRPVSQTASYDVRVNGVSLVSVCLLLP